MASTTSSKIEYLKRYGFNNEEDKKKKKKKKKDKPNAGAGVLVVDEDPVWQKPVTIEEEDDNDAGVEDIPQVDVDIEVKRMRRLEEIRSRRPFGSLSEDGSGWVSVSETPNPLDSTDISPPRRWRQDTPSPECEDKPHSSMSPPRRRRLDTPSPERGSKPSSVRTDLSPPRRQRAPELSSSGNKDLSPPRKRTARNDSSSPEALAKASAKAAADLSPPRRRQNGERSPQRRKLPTSSGSDLRGHNDIDSSPPHRRRARFDSLSPDREPKRMSSRSTVSSELNTNPIQIRGSDSHIASALDLSPVRKSRKDISVSGDRSARGSAVSDLYPPRKLSKEPSVPKQRPLTGLVTGRDLKEEISRIKRENWSSFKEIDPSASGRGAEPVYRDKSTGKRISKDEFLKPEKKEEKPKEVKLEWGKGLAQKREAEARLQELEEEKNKPFARSRDEPELDRMLKERVRWGDPMAHLVKKKQLEPILPDLGDNERMKESGFIIPQEVPSHSWIKRGSDAAPNRYGIKPGRHWDGVDRSNGYEKELFKRMNEKEATQREAYLWSVADM